MYIFHDIFKLFCAFHFVIFHHFVTVERVRTLAFSCAVFIPYKVQHIKTIVKFHGYWKTQISVIVYLGFNRDSVVDTETSNWLLYLDKKGAFTQSVLFQCWATIFDAGPTLKQHWLNAPCLLGCCIQTVFIMTTQQTALAQWCYNVGSPSVTLVQHSNNIGSCVCCVELGCYYSSQQYWWLGQ